VTPLLIRLACGITVEIKPAPINDEIVVMLRPQVAGFVAWSVDHVRNCRSAEELDDPGHWSLWIGRTSIELDNAAQAQQAQAWIDAHRERIQQAERVGVLQA
jgi:hypothetical protein